MHIAIIAILAGLTAIYFLTRKPVEAIPPEPTPTPEPTPEIPPEALPSPPSPPIPVPEPEAPVSVEPEIPIPPTFEPVFHLPSILKTGLDVIAVAGKKSISGIHVWIGWYHHDKDKRWEKGGYNYHGFAKIGRIRTPAILGFDAFGAASRRTVNRSMPPDGVLVTTYIRFTNAMIADFTENHGKPTGLVDVSGKIIIADAEHDVASDGGYCKSCVNL